MTESPTLVESSRRAVARAKQWRPIRVWKHYLDNRGPLMAGGMTYSSLFSVFAGVWVGFSVLGLFVSSRDGIWQTLIEFVDAQVPGLLDTGNGGLIDVDVLGTSTAILSWTGAIALATLAFTSMGWMRAAQNGARGMFGLTGKERGPFMSQVVNLAALIAVALLLLISAVASVITANIGQWWSSIAGLRQGSLVSIILTRGGAGVISVALDFLIILMFVVVLGSISVPWRSLWPGALMGAIAISTLKIGGSLLIGGATGNPLLASFAVLIGFMLWLNFISHSFLIAIAWVAVDAAGQASDAGPGTQPHPEILKPEGSIDGSS